MSISKYRPRDKHGLRMPIREGGLRTVHLVDDDPSILAAMKRRLKLAGFNLLTYSTAEKFLEHEDNEQAPSLLVLDVEMPGMSGLELQDLLRERGSTLPIFFVSGRTDESVRSKAIENGAVDFLAKPVNSDQLLRAINAAMARHGMVRAHVGVTGQFVDELFARAAAVIIEARVLREQRRRWREQIRLSISYRSARATFSPKGLTFDHA